VKKDSTGIFRAEFPRARGKSGKSGPGFDGLLTGLFLVSLDIAGVMAFPVSLLAGVKPGVNAIRQPKTEKQ